LPLAIVVAGLVWIFLWRTVIGFRDARGRGKMNPRARAAGIDAGKDSHPSQMALAGGLAGGWVGVGEVLGNAAKFRLGFFAGVWVHRGSRSRCSAAIGRAGVVAAALAFRCTAQGRSGFGFGRRKHVTREVSLILQALIILSVVGGRIVELDDETAGRIMTAQLFASTLRVSTPLIFAAARRDVRGTLGA